MAIVQHRLTAWIWQATEADRRTGFVEMTRAQYDAAVTEGRAQDPRVGALHLKHVVNDLYVPADPEGRQGEERPGRRLASRRRAAPATEE